MKETTYIIMTGRMYCGALVWSEFATFGVQRNAESLFESLKGYEHKKLIKRTTTDEDITP